MAKKKTLDLLSMSDQTAQKCPGGNTGTPGQAHRARAHAFTSFKQDPPKFDNEKMRYLAYAQETCPSTKKKHWQGWVYWKNAKTNSASGKNLDNAHSECMKGSFTQNDKYCSKENSLTTFGKRPNQGAFGGVDDICTAIIEKTITIDEVLEENPWAYHQYGRTFQAAEDLMMRKTWRTEATTCEWLVGPTGVGKSHYAFKNYHPDTHYLWKHDKGWWDNYRQQDTVIINDYRGEIAYNDLLQMIDKWPYDVSRRNRKPMPFISKHIIITSSLTPQQIYHNRLAEDDIAQLMRRIKIIDLRKREKYDEPPERIEIISA